jgi:hypothetical protein
VGVVDPVPGGDERNARSTACTAPAARTSNPNRRNHLRLTATRLTLGDREGRDLARVAGVDGRTTLTRHPGFGSMSPCACTPPASFLPKASTPHRCSPSLLCLSGQEAFEFSGA